MTTAPLPSGVLHIVGVGPGDPDLMTVRAARILAAAPVFAHFAKHGQPGHARGVALACLRADAAEMRFEYPMTTELPPGHPCYRTRMRAFYDEAATALAARLASTDVALLCEGDPFFYGSAMYMFDRLRTRHTVEVVPGITGMSGAWTRAGLPVAHGDDVLTVLPGTLPEAELAARLAGTDAAVVMKVGRNLPKIRAALGGRSAFYVERATGAAERILPIAEAPDGPAPYFSLILLPGRAGER